MEKETSTHLDIMPLNVMIMYALQSSDYSLASQLFLQVQSELTMVK